MILVPPPGGWEQGRRPPPRPPAWLPVQRDPEPGRPVPPPEVLAAFPDFGPGGNWEAGTVDRAGRRWVHQPYVGWRMAGPGPYLAYRGHVYTSFGVRRRRRREDAARWLVPPGGLLALALLCGGLLNFDLGWAAAGALLSVALVALVVWGLLGGRPR